MAALACCAFALLLWTGGGEAAGSAGTAGMQPRGPAWSELEKKYDGVFVLSASRQTRKVALTFDDVPDPRYTGYVLDTLKRKKVRATFFVVGYRAAAHPELVRRMVKEGHVVGNHSYNHPDFSKIRRLDRVQEQIVRTERIIRKQTGYAPRLFRPPYGEIRPVQLEWAKAHGYTVVNWDVDSKDWRQLSKAQIMANVTGAIRPGSIVLLHAGGGVGQKLWGTVGALPELIDWLRSHGYEPVTLSDLLDVPAGK